MGVVLMQLLSHGVCVILGFALGCVSLVRRSRALLLEDAAIREAREFYRGFEPCDAGVC